MSFVVLNRYDAANVAYSKQYRLVHFSFGSVIPSFKFF